MLFAGSFVVDTEGFYDPWVTFDGFPVAALDFYDDLELDNTKSFWEKHKHVYAESVKAPMAALMEALGLSAALGAFIAGVMLALTIPLKRTPAPPEARGSESPLHRLEHALIVPATAAQGPPRRAGGVPLPEWRGHSREGGSGVSRSGGCSESS